MNKAVVNKAVPFWLFREPDTRNWNRILEIGTGYPKLEPDTRNWKCSDTRVPVNVFVKTHKINTPKCIK